MNYFPNRPPQYVVFVQGRPQLLLTNYDPRQNYNPNIMPITALRPRVQRELLFWNPALLPSQIPQREHNLQVQPQFVPCIQRREKPK